jgi:hypothetical protein
MSRPNASKGGIWRKTAAAPGSQRFFSQQLNDKLMVIRVEDLLQKLGQVTYYNYLSYQNDAFVFITLYKEEEPEAFVIIEPVPAEQYQRLVVAVRFHQQ